MTKEELKQSIYIREELADIRASLEVLEAALYAPRAQALTGMPGGSKREGSLIETLSARHMELEQQVERVKADLEAELARIETAIESVPHPLHRKLLRLRYIKGLGWEEVSVKMKYSWRQTHRMHSDALQSIAGWTDREGEDDKI